VTCASTSSTSMPEKATVRTRATNVLLLSARRELYGNGERIASSAACLSLAYHRRCRRVARRVEQARENGDV
jgi:hypothetical protein